MHVAIFVVFLAVYGVGYLLLFPRIGLIATTLAAPFIVGTAWGSGALVAIFYGVSLLPLEFWIMSMVGAQGRLLDPATLFTAAGVLVFTAITALVRRIIADRDLANHHLNLAREIADDGMWDWRINENVVDYSPRWFTMLGYAPNEYPGTYETFADLLHPEDKRRAEGIIMSAVEGQTDEFQMDFRLRGKEGSYRWVLARGRVIERDSHDHATRMIGIHSDIHAQKRVEEEIVFFAYHDQLSGLPNRKSLYERLEEAVKLARRGGGQSMCGVIMLDIDDFKSINDTLGQALADRVITAFANRLRQSIRASDHLFHLGGDDFCILLQQLKDDTDLGVVADKIRRRSQEPLAVGDTKAAVQPSMGLAVFPRDGEDAMSLAASAETALVEAKREHNTYRFYTKEMYQKIVDRVTLVEELRRGIAGEEFTVYYQPIVNDKRQLVAAEALVRWDHPERGIVGPGEFVDIAEDTGLIVDIGEQVIGRVCADVRRMIDLGHEPVPISVNLSVKQLSTAAVVQQVKGALAFHRISADLLSLEITESSVMENLSTTLSTIEALVAAGLRFSIDDFGTGYSSLSYLKRLPIHTVKIDRSFVIELPESHKDAAIVRSIISMADGLGLGLIAEGVDNTRQVEFLIANGCTRMQGFLFSRPVPPHQLQCLLVKGVEPGCDDGATSEVP